MDELMVDALAAARLTRLVGRDRITAGPRARLAPIDTRRGYWARCPWCAGLWASAAVLLARRMMPRLWGPVARVLAVSQTVGMAAAGVEWLDPSPPETAS